MVNLLKRACVILLLSLPYISHEMIAQEVEEEKNRISLVLGHAIIPNGKDVGNNNSRFILAAWGLDYDHYFSEKWGLGIHSDWVVENYTVETSFGDSKEVEREKPLTLCLVSSYSLLKHLSVHAGGGGELAEGESYYLIRLGAEASWELEEKWEFGITLSNDLKPEAYNSLMLGFALGRFF